MSDAGKVKVSGVFEGFTISKSSASPEVKDTPVTDAIEVATEQAPKSYDHQVAKAPLLDDSYWRTVVVDSNGDNVCSYELLNADAETTNNVFEIQISNMKNIEIGLYYGQYEKQEDLGFEL